MGKDYYQVLELNRDANESDIAKAYRRLSLRWHPKLSKEDQNTSYHHFCEISEAYEVLSDPIKRAFYDKYGEEKLKEGFFSKGNLKGGYRFGGNPEEIFEKFYGSNNPFAQI
jgi:DnaJ family protein B protein 13